MQSMVDPGTPRRASEVYVERVFDEIAAVTGTPQTELPRLADTLDAEALERLWQRADDTLTCSFEYHGCEVTVHGDGTVDVVELEA